MLNGETQISMKCWACGRTTVLYFDAVNKVYRCSGCDMGLVPAHDQLELKLPPHHSRR